MDNRNTLIAMTVCMALILGWTYFSEVMGWTNRSLVTTQEVAPATEQVPDQQVVDSAAPASGGAAGHPAAISSQNPAAFPASGIVAPAVSEDGKPAEIVVETPLYSAKFSALGGILTSFELKNYTVSSEYQTEAPRRQVQIIAPEATAFAPMGILINNKHSWRNAVWSVENSAGGNALNLESSAPGTLTFVGRLDDLTIKRVLTFEPNTYVVREELFLSSAQAQTLNLGYSISTGNLAGPEDYLQINQVARVQGGSFEIMDSESDLANGQDFGTDVAWGGSMSNYFLAAMIPANPLFRMEARLSGSVYTVAMKNDAVQVSPEAPTRSEMFYYFGPKQQEDLMAAPGNLVDAVDYGWFGWIAKPLMVMLKFFYDYVGNWGVAIILMTVVIKIVLWPLSYKSYKSMQGMKAIQPHMAKIREKHKGDKERLNREMMQLYKTYKVNPAGGCLPILVQLPVFIGLYKALLAAFELRQASFIPHLPFTDMLWLADLSLKDPLYITPIVMGVSMFIQQKITPAVGDPTQQKIMMFMPIIFTVMFINFPSGLVVYWLVNNIISIAQQQWQMKRKPGKA
ncbi:MAG: membrane protein insertase YidC [Deltaproteobacteria bacterium]|jgi:YidC/Oxa1 family membrane protein insertase|nr:membrane protein insertase YidC [Deltaproteobacteria bacterium]